MSFNLTSLIIDAAELDGESAFWHRLLGGSITKAPTHHFLQVDGLPVIVIQHVPEQVPPHWPGGADQQLHFDLATDDLPAADNRVLDAGGRRLQPADDAISEQDSSRVYGSPAGHPFCIRVARGGSA